MLLMTLPSSAKHSRPARAYLHLSEDYVKGLQPKEHLGALTSKLAETHFVDARSTHTDPVLLNPWPTVSESPYGRIPSSRIRKDNRQGTIDQDQEFIDFLQELTDPVVKPTPIDALPEKEPKPEEKVVTPLVQYLKDKKANKNKEPSGSSKPSKHGRQESKDGKVAGQAPEKKQPTKSGKGTSADRKPSPTRKAEKPAKEQVKVLNKPAAASGASRAQGSSQNAAAAQALPQAQTAPKQERKRERGSAAAAAKILQRDLGLAGASPSRRRAESSNITNSGTDKGAPAQSAKPANASTTSSSTSAAAAALLSAQVSSEPGPSDVSHTTTTPRDPASNKQSSKVSAAAAKSAAMPKTVNAARQQPVTPTATQAFLKHANPSQGVTEDLLRATFAGFGVVTKVEIDKKKGFAYLDFAEPASLQQAIGASPVKIAQGQVTVLERKAPQQNKIPRVESRSARGGSAGAPSQQGGRGRAKPNRGQAEGQSQPTKADTTNASSGAGASGKA